MTSYTVFSQNFVQFNRAATTATASGEASFQGLKGNLLQIGNNILNRQSNSQSPNNPYNGTGVNNNFNMQYIDIDGDASTFNSTTADLTIPVATAGCYRIRFAGLYWAGVYNPNNIGTEVDRTRLNEVKFKLPGGNYIDITGTTIFDSFTVPQAVSSNNFGYAAYVDVTTLVQSLPDANGTYGVANIQSGLGGNTSGGWNLVIVYEDPLTTAKNIDIFNGFSNIRSGDPALDIPITGFNAIPIGPVRAQLAFAALEGDRAFTDDRLRINGTSMTIPTRPANNFFSATINDINGPYNARNINSTNLLGFDAGIINVPNPGNSVIANSATSATVRLETNNDSYVYYMNAFAIEVIQPQINLVKVVRDLAGNDIGNSTVALGQEIYYDLDFQNIGNDDAVGFTITDQLPINVTFLPADIVVPPGVTYTFAPPPSNTITFTIPDNLVTEFGANYQIRIRVRVAENCYDLRDACSNEITNTAYKTYSSSTSGNIVENQQPSASGIDACLFPSPGATNFIADIDDCTFEAEEVLCGSSVTLTAGSGYDSYQWYSGSPPNAGNIINGATNQSYTANSTGTYSVVNTAPAPCLSITETFNVVDFNGVVPNPVIPYADQVDICPIDGSELPKIFLCGASDSQLIESGILNAQTIVWEVLSSTAGCTSTPPPTCPNTTCPDSDWTQVGTGPNFNAVDAGEYRVTITFQNGCFRTYYFNVYKNLFTPTAVATDEICTTPGTITVNGVPPTGYEFSITSATGPWQQNDNFFNNVPAGTYTVYTQQIGGGVGNCLFTIPNVVVNLRNFDVDVTVDDALCNGDKGEIRVQVNNVEPQYYYELLLGGNPFANAGPIAANDYTFSNLNAGNYTLNVSTDDGCTYTQNITISNPTLLTVTGNVTIPLTCENGEITLYPVGGTPPYIYTISGDTDLYSVPNFVITTPGTYTFTVTDFNNCTATTDVTIDAIPAPEFTITQTDVLCNGGATGEIVFNVTNTNGYTIEYSVTTPPNTPVFGSNPVFSNLPAGTYEAQLQYSLNGTVCPPIIQIITITEPANAVEASAGVSELAGCGPNGEGRVRITNPQGGSGVYEYSFDGGSTWGSANEAYLPPGSYTVCIRDANSPTCTACYPVTIDPAPQDPTITVDDPTYNCDGTATTTVTVNNNGGNFAYTYSIDGNLNTNTPSNVFVDVPCGPHTITVGYQNLNIPTYSDLLREDFGSGANTTTPGIAAAYCWNSQPYPATTPCGNNAIPGYAPVCGSYTIEDNQYSVTSAIIPNNCNWFAYRDHTQVLTGTPDPNGRFLAVNIGSAAGNYGILYSKVINSVLPNQPVLVDLYVANLLRAGVAGADPDFILELVDPSGTVVASQATGIIDNTVDGWQFQTLSLNPGNNTTLTFNIRSGSILYSGNDAAIDDIYVRQEPIACITEVEFPILVDCNQAFSAQITGFSDVSCNGANDGEITIAAQNFDPTNGYYYSLTGGAPFTQTFTSPLTITGLAAGSYNVVIQYDLSSTPCSFPFTQVIGEPTALVAGAVLSSPATCLNGGTITASASGGTPNYQYELQDTSGNVIAPYSLSANNVFSDLPPGDYIVVVQDALLCTDPIDVAINIPTPTAPTAVIDASSDLCYDGANGATIVVTASGGVPAYTYSINGSTFGTNNTFTVTPGTYTIIVRDSYGCEVTLPAVTIAPELTATAVLTNGLDCTASPDADIDVTINGGTAPYTYEVLFNTASLGTFPTGNTFTYTTPNPGDYQFVITDAIGCTVTTTTVTVIPLPVLNAPVATQTAFNLCNGDSNGAFTVTASGGLPPYMYSIDGTNFQTGNNFSGQTAGTYTVTVIDANSCTETTTITLVEPDPINFTIVKTDIQCGATGTEPGSIDVTNVTGGTAPYTYTITDNPASAGFPTSYTTVGSEDHSFTILNFGIYTVTVVDANGCVLVQNNISIASPPNSLTIDISTPTADCTTGGTIVVTANPIVVGGPYYFAIYNGAPYPTISFISPGVPNPPYQVSDTPGGLTSTFNGLIPGVTYSFIVYDESTNCYYFESASGPVPTPSNITSTVTPHNITCTGAGDGSVSFTVDNFAGVSVSYQIYNVSGNTPVGPPGNSPGPAPVTVNNFGTLLAGQYYILFTENGGPNNGCTQVSANFTISESPVLLSLTAVVTNNDNLCSEAGQITVTGSNGTAPYTYQIVTGGSPAPTTWVTNNVFSNLPGGTYDVYIQDANGCIQPFTSVFVPTDSSPEITATLDASTLCNPTEGNYSITVNTNASVGVPPFTYIVDTGGPVTFPSNPYTITGLNSGTHTITIIDANGCTDTETVIINPPLNSNIITSVAASGNCGVSDGIITVTAGGGSGSYTYSISPNGAPISLAGNVFSNVPAGSYVVTVTDNTTGCFINSNVTLVQPTNPSFTTTVVDVTCNGGANGLITVNLTGSNPDAPYTYEITAGPVTFPAQSGNVFSGLPAGNYTVVVTSDRGCSTTAVVTVNEPAAIVVPAPTVTEFACNTGTNTVNNASIVVTGVTGGSGTYINYVFTQGSTTLQSGSSNTYVESNVNGGTYTITVSDNNGCLGTTTATIAPFIQISNPTVTVASPITCTTLEDITINVTTTGGVPTTLNYTVVGLSAGSTYNVTQVNNPNFTGLEIGNYEITVENATTGCSVQTIHYVFNPNTFIVNATVNNNVTCFGGADGSVSFTFVDQNLTPTNDAGPFTYEIYDASNTLVTSGFSGSAGPFPVNGLAAGVYQLVTTLTASPFCPAVTTFTITQPTTALTITPTSTPITCNPGNDGTISAVGANGWGGPYEYQLQGPVNVAWSSNAYFTGLSAGTYTVSVRDIEGCEVSTTVTLVIPTPITATISATPTALLCVGDNDATITVSGTTGGFGSGYLYTLNTLSVTPNTASAPQTSNVFTNLGAGTYNVTITDSFNCTFTTTDVTITEPADQVVATLAQIYDPTCQTDAILELTASGGTAPYSWSLTPGGPYTTFVGSVQFTVPAGTYQYYVIDANNCIEVVSNSREVEPVIPVSVSVDLSSTVISCNGFTTEITATASNGLGNYVYTLVPNNGANQNSPGVFTNVPAGTYTIEVVDGDCVGVSEPFTITNPPAIDVTTSFTNITCASDPTNGTISVIATGGTGTIQYSISSAPNETVNSGLFTDLSPGNYTVNVQDQSGCPAGPFFFTISNAPDFNLDSRTVVDEICLGDGGSVQFSVSGGTTTATVGYTATEGSLTQTSFNGDFSFPNLAVGFHQFFVTDANGCILTVDFDIQEGVDIQASVDYEILCDNNIPSANVTVAYNTDLDINDLTFDLDNGAVPSQVGNNIFENVPAGPHTITVTHSNTCQTPPIDFTIVLPSTPSITSFVQSGLNQFTITATGGEQPYEYTIINGNGTVVYVGPSNVYIYNQTSNYTVIVTDINGCTATDTKPFTFYDVEIPDYFTPGGDGTNDGWSPNYLDNYPKAVTYVFDRYSRKIITLRPGETWDGTYMGNELPSGDYWYVLKLNGETDAREFVGNFTLYR